MNKSQGLDAMTNEEVVGDGPANVEGSGNSSAASVPTIGPEIDRFVRHVESMGNGLMLSLIVAVQEQRKAAGEELESFDKKHCKVEQVGGETLVTVPGEWAHERRRLAAKLHTSSISLRNLPSSAMVSLISYFDAYLGRLIKTIYLRKPELLNSSERKLTFEEMSRFKSIEAVREYVIEKEVESVLRCSHVEHFRWMERVYGLPLTKGLKSWPDFVELTERRNLLVHTDGVVSTQYLIVCKQQGCVLPPELKEGTRLGMIPQGYFNRAYACVFEIGFKLGHVLWRKHFPEERDEADKSLILGVYELLVTHQYALAADILDFICDHIKVFHSEVYKLMLIVNRALAYKWMGDQKAAKLAMKGVDWSAKSDVFRLANALIVDDWPQAIGLVKRIGADGPVSKSDYRSWSLFKEFRKRADFKAAFADVFKESFDKAEEVQIVATEDADAVTESFKADAGDR